MTKIEEHEAFDSSCKRYRPKGARRLSEALLRRCNGLDRSAEAGRVGGGWCVVSTRRTTVAPSIEDGIGESCISKRHVCYTVSNLREAEERFRNAGIEILPDDIPTPGWNRFYVRDPGGNRLEIAQEIELCALFIEGRTKLKAQN